MEYLQANQKLLQDVSAIANCSLLLKRCLHASYLHWQYLHFFFSLKKKKGKEKHTKLPLLKETNIKNLNLILSFKFKNVGLKGT